MKKTFITTLPDKVGAFLKAGQCFAGLGINITRTSYNKAVDVHTLFIEAEGQEADLKEAEEMLKNSGFLPEEKTEPVLTVLEFRLQDKPGQVVTVLELIKAYGFNISYINSRENGTDFQPFKIGFIAGDMGKLEEFIKEAEKICPVKNIEYDKTEINYDNTIFYNSFAEGLANLAGLPPEVKRKLSIYANMAMQMLDDRGESAFTTFDCIKSFAEHIVKYKGEDFVPRITWHTLSKKTDLIIIEPPCGSNTMILRSGGQYLYIDTGYACYRKEMEQLFSRIFHDYHTAPRALLLTHSDVDHCGLIDLFETVYVSEETYKSFDEEVNGNDGLREKNRAHKPYSRICKLLTGYLPCSPDKMRIISQKKTDAIIEQTGDLQFGDMSFTVYEGAGGHVPGELIIADWDKKICFTGDIFINMKDMIPQQKQYNAYAPVLMTNVDINPALAAEERKEIRKMFAGFRIIGSHGAPYQA